jgi:hypothetical protein
MKKTMPLTSELITMYFGEGNALPSKALLKDMIMTANGFRVR